MAKPARTSEQTVRIGELVVAVPGSGTLVASGLGSCIGLAILEPNGRAAGLAHVFLPEPPDGGPKPGVGPGTYAPIAVPTILAEVARLGRVPPRSLIAVLAGGAAMFAMRERNDIGARNLEIVTSCLAVAGVQIVAQETGGTQGRTIRIACSEDAISVSVRTVGNAQRDVWRSSELRIHTSHGRAA